MLHALYEVNIIMNTITEEIKKFIADIKWLENFIPYEEDNIEYHQIATKQANQQS